ncbi:MAG: DHH family phosphoesterase [Nitrososphaerales archaeon]
MGNFESLKTKAAHIAERIVEVAERRQRIIIIGHIDADGISSASLIANSLRCLEAPYTIRIYNDLSIQALQALKESEYDLYILCEMGGGMLKDIETNLGSKWVLIDHHQVPQEELEHPSILNAWAYGFDGGVDACAATLSYYVAANIDHSIKNFSWLPVVAALADKQDQGERRALTGANKVVLEVSKEAGLINDSVDLLFYGRETRAVHEALAATTTPYIHGLSGNREACLNALNAGGIKLREDDRWRTLAELTIEEKQKIVEVLLPYIGGRGVDELVGYIYTLVKEDEFSPLRDAREFGTLLNACGRMGKAGLAIGLCLGDRGYSLSEAEKVLAEYRQTISRLVKVLTEDETRIIKHQLFNLIVAEGLVNAEMLGSLSSILSSVPKFSEKPLFLTTRTKEGNLRVSARIGAAFKGQVNIGLTLRKVAEKVNGQGGGHKAAGGATLIYMEPSKLVEVLQEGLNVDL